MKSAQERLEEIVRLTAERDEWKALAGALRNHESRIQGILADLDYGEPTAAWLALADIAKLVDGPRSTSAKPETPSDPVRAKP